MTNIEKLKYIVDLDDNEKLLDWLYLFVIKQYGAKNIENIIFDEENKQILKDYLSESFLENYDEGKGIWFISNMDDGRVFDTFKDPDADTVDIMCKRADALDNDFMVTRLSEDAIKMLYYKYVMNAKNKIC